MKYVHFSTTLCFEYSNRFPSNAQRRKVEVANMRWETGSNRPTRESAPTILKSLLI